MLLTCTIYVRKSIGKTPALIQRLWTEHSVAEDTNYMAKHVAVSWRKRHFALVQRQGVCGLTCESSSYTAVESMTYRKGPESVSRHSNTCTKCDIVWVSCKTNKRVPKMNCRGIHTRMQIFAMVKSTTLQGPHKYQLRNGSSKCVDLDFSLMRNLEETILYLHHYSTRNGWKKKKEETTKVRQREKERLRRGAER